MRTVVGAFAIVALTATGAAAQTETEHVSRTVRLEPGGTLRLRNFSGHVTITGSDQPQVVVDAVRTAPRERLERVKLDVHLDGTTVVVDANQRDDTWFGSRNNVVRTDLDVKVPTRTNLDVRVFSSPVEIRGVDGAHNLHGFSSSLRLDDVAGPVQAHTFSGEVSIRARAWPSNQTIDVDTFSGSIDLRVPESARGDVRFHSFSGHLTSEMPLTLRKAGRRSLEGRLGGDSGGGAVNLKTFSGDVKIAR
jgi:DUF4097 and DUF4098 domain-containing protein YvlB